MSLLSYLGLVKLSDLDEKVESLAQARAESIAAKRVSKEEDDIQEKSLPYCHVGITGDGRVSLRLGAYSNATLTLNNEGVDRLCRMLQAAKDTEDEAEK